MTRQLRRAAAREALKLAASVERVDPALLQLLLASNEKLGAAQKAAVEAQGTINSVTEQITSTHKLKPGDQLNLKSGIIQRAKRSKGK